MKPKFDWEAVARSAVLEDPEQFTAVVGAFTKALTEMRQVLKPYREKDDDLPASLERLAKKCHYSAFDHLRVREAITTANQVTRADQSVGTGVRDDAIRALKWFCEHDWPSAIPSSFLSAAKVELATISEREPWRKHLYFADQSAEGAVQRARTAVKRQMENAGYQLKRGEMMAPLADLARRRKMCAAELVHFQEALRFRNVVDKDGGQLPAAKARELIEWFSLLADRFAAVAEVAPLTPPRVEVNEPQPAAVVSDAQARSDSHQPSPSPSSAQATPRRRQSLSDLVPHKPKPAAQPTSNERSMDLIPGTGMSARLIKKWECTSPVTTSAFSFNNQLLLLGGEALGIATTHGGRTVFSSTGAVEACCPIPSVSGFVIVANGGILEVVHRVARGIELIDAPRLRPRLVTSDGKNILIADREDPNRVTLLRPRSPPSGDQYCIWKQSYTAKLEAGGLHRSTVDDTFDSQNVYSYSYVLSRSFEGVSAIAITTEALVCGTESGHVVWVPQKDPRKARVIRTQRAAIQSVTVSENGLVTSFAEDGELRIAPSSSMKTRASLRLRVSLSGIAVTGSTLEDALVTHASGRSVARWVPSTRMEASVRLPGAVIALNRDGSACAVLIDGPSAKVATYELQAHSPK